MESLEQISKKYKNMLTGKNKECLIENDEYILYLNHYDKNGNKMFKCKFYKDNQFKYKAFDKFYRNNTLISYNDQHSSIIYEKKINL